MYKQNTSLKRKESQEFMHPYRNATWFSFVGFAIAQLPPTNIFISNQWVTIQHINKHKYKQGHMKTQGTMNDNDNENDNIKDNDNDNDWLQ